MDPDRWARAKAVFHAALDRPREEREEFVRRMCSDDSAVYAEVASLLASHRSDDFLEVPAAACEAEAGEIDDEIAGLAGGRLGPYEVMSRLGQGGMGVVYLGRDTRLNRLVAIKALKPAFTQDPRRRARLAREARAAAALSHPAIATVYALEEFEGNMFIIGEYVRGETLRQELARAGPLPSDRLVATSVVIAEALAAAHAQGVVHRDLKPENIIRNAEGSVKILDFGLARMVESSDEGVTVASQLTEIGGIAGTPAYMAPEQLRGETVDFRADIFAFGALVYELASGFQPFGGRDPISAITRVLNEQPQRLALRAPVPTALDGIVDRCLRKAPGSRYASTPDLVSDLQRLHRELSESDRASRREDAYRFGRLDSIETVGPLRWWEIHQLVSGLVPCVLLGAFWQVQRWTQGALGAVLLVATSVAAVALATLRLHLWFTSRFYPRELAAQRRRGRPWIVVGELMVILQLLVGAALVVGAHRTFAALLAAVAVALAITSTIIEPATTRAAFGEDDRQ